MSPSNEPAAPAEPLTPEEWRLTEGRSHDPRSVLGLHAHPGGTRLIVFLPHAASVQLEPAIPLRRHGQQGLFVGSIIAPPPSPYRLVWKDTHGQTHTCYEPYTLPLQLTAHDLHQLAQGQLMQAYRVLGAHLREVAGLAGVLFAVWAPNALRVSVVGDFNAWDGRCHPLQLRGSSGVWELFLPDIGPGTLYKFEICPRSGAHVLLKSDPYGQGFELRPATASVVTAAAPEGTWKDAAWMATRSRKDWLRAPLSVYEVHLGSWARDSEGRWLGYRDLAHRVAHYALGLGFTHIELMPITEHPFDGSWGYQSTGYFAPTRRHGLPEDFRYLVDHCHQQGLGVLLDWVPGHFPRDGYALAGFDGTALYEHADPRLGEHPDWGTLIFNFGRHEVRNFLIASALYWLDEYHIDGLRVDAVASMLYRDYSRADGTWLPNAYGGRENLEAIAFLQQLNHEVLTRYPGTLMIAEESTAWPGVTRPPDAGGLGFSMKWNMGWMHDMLNYLQLDPVYRAHHHNLLTFGMLYAFSENFVLSFSHDEVVHGKRSLLGRMPGDEWQRFANLRLLYICFYTWPGKKLLFMGNEFAQREEWSHDRALDWALAEQPAHAGIQALVRDLNHLYRTYPALHAGDFSAPGFEWIDCNDQTHSMLCYLRRDGAAYAVVVLNFTPVPRHDYRVGVPGSGAYREALNSDSTHYGGSNIGNAGLCHAQAVSAHGRAWSILLTVPPLAGLILMPIENIL